MKIFISWSGTYSEKLAVALKEWLLYIFPNDNLFVSSEDIRKGKKWALALAKELEETKVGILCLTRENLAAPWIMFEAGSISKAVNEAYVFTVLFDNLRPSDITGPLADFQHTVFEKKDFFKMLKAINEAHSDGKQDEHKLLEHADMLWANLEKRIKEAGTGVKISEEQVRSTEDMLKDILETVTQIARNMPDTSDPVGFFANDPADKRSDETHEKKWQSFVTEIWPILLHKLAQKDQKLADALKKYVQNVRLNDSILVLGLRDIGLAKADFLIGNTSTLKDLIRELALPSWKIAWEAPSMQS